MKISRRDILRWSALALAFSPLASAQGLVRQPSKPLRILILGGTGFLGPHQVQAALDRGHKVTIFNRGKTGLDLFPAVEHLTGDRETGDLSALRGRSWDAVIDNCRDSPGWVKDSTAALKNSTTQYLYVSSISVYADPSVVGLKESATLNVLPPEPGAEKAPGNYGGAKAECERLTREAFPDTHIIPRPGLLVGPGDPTDRFTYWPVRVHRGGEVVAPGKPTDPTQWIDARDAADWMLHAIETEQYGIFNLSGPRTNPTTMGEFLAEVNKTAAPVQGEGVEFCWVSAEVLESQGVNPWSDMPLWVPPGSAVGGFTSIDISKALASGLVFRPMSQTISDVLAWHESLEKNPDEPMKAGLTSARELALLEKMKSADSTELKVSLR